MIYFVVLFVTEKRSLKIIWNFALYSLLAGGMAAVLLVPEVCAILQTNFGNPDFPDKLKSYFSVLDMLARHCMSVTTERGLEHLPNIYCGVAVFLLLPMYALNHKISIRKRFANLAVAGFMLLSFSTNILDFAWHGMNYPDSLPARQSFLYIFLVLVMCYEAYRNVNEIEEKQILYGYLAAVVFLLCCEKFISSPDFNIGIEILTLVFVTIYAVILYLHRTKPNAGMRYKTALGAVALVVVIAESSINMYNTSIGTIERAPYLNDKADYKALYDWTLKQEGGAEFYRMEKFTRKTKNDGTLAGYPTASVFSSTMNSSVKELYKQLGMRHSKVYYGYDGATPFSSALLNVRYLFGTDDKYENSLFTQVEKSGEIWLYEAVNTLPFGYVAPLSYDLPEGVSNNGLLVQNKMVNALGIDGEMFVKVATQSSVDTIQFSPVDNAVYYGLVTASGTKKMEVTGGALETEKYNDLKKGSVIYLGNLMAGESITLKNSDSKDDSKEISVDIYRMNEVILQEAMEKLSAQHLEDVTYDSRHVNGRITMQEPGRLILSIPYEKGWKVTVNGQKTEPNTFGGTFISFDFGPGEYEISMKYTPEGKYAGILISVLSIGIFAGLTLWEKRKKE